MDNNEEFSHLHGTIELRQNEDGSYTLQGYAAKFNTLSHPFGSNFYEQIEPGAFTRALADKAHVGLYISHDGLALASTKSGTLRLSQDNVGLRMSANLDSTDPDVQRVLPKIKRGDLSEMSFGFKTAGTKASVGTTPDGKKVRTLSDVNLFDVSMVERGQYPDTELKLRALQEAFQDAEEQEMIDDYTAACKAIIEMRTLHKDLHDERFS